MNQENNFNLQDNNGMPNNQSLNSNQVVGYDSQTGQPIYASQNNSLDNKLLMAFIGNNYEQIMQQKFSIPALFLSWIYTLYRRIYLPSIIGMVAIILLGFLPSIIYTIIVFAFVIVLGINFNKWYVAYAKKQVEKIKISNRNINENELINICKKKGGTNIWLAILIYAIFVIVSGFLNPNVSQLYGSNDDVIKILNSNSYFQNSVGVGSNFSGIYYFKDDNTFVFSNKDNVSENNQVIYMCGSWEYNKNTLKLTIKEQYKTKNGIQVNDVVSGKKLIDYTIVKEKVQEIKNYKIKLSSLDGVKYINGDIVLYKVGLNTEEIDYYFNLECYSNNQVEN